MGLLKHFVFPILILLHINVVYLGMFSGDRINIPKAFDWPMEDGRELNQWENHAFGIITGGHLALLVAEVYSVVVDTAHVRGLLGVMEFIWWLWGAFDAQANGQPCEFAYIISGVLAISLIIHSQEPGIFTKDKDKEKEKSM